MEPDIDLHLGKRLRARRRLLGWTQHQLAVMVGVRFQQIQKYECGANRISAARLWRMSEILEVSIEFFYEGLPQAPRALESRRADGAESLAREDSLDLIRTFYQLDESPRRRLLDLAKSLNTDDAEAA